MANGVPPPFLSVSPFESMRSGGAIPPPQKGYLSDTCAIPYENIAKWCDTPLCDTISKGYCKRYGGVSRTGPLRSNHRLTHLLCKPRCKQGQVIPIPTVSEVVKTTTEPVVKPTETVVKETKEAVTSKPSSPTVQPIEAETSKTPSGEAEASKPPSGEAEASQPHRDS